MSRLAVFGYGSLVSAQSAAETLGRPVETPIPARLQGWRRTWSLARDNFRSEKTFARADGTLPRFCLGLDIEPSTDPPSPNGALIELSDGELERLDVREIRYDRIEVTASITPSGEPFDAVFVYRARPEHHRPIPPDDAILIANYLRTVEAAFAELGVEELELFRATTPTPSVEVAEAFLVGDRIPPGNPREW